MTGTGVSVWPRMMSAPEATSSSVAAVSSSGSYQAYVHRISTRASGFTERAPWAKALVRRTVSGITTGPTTPIRSLRVMCPATTPAWNIACSMRPKYEPRFGPVWNPEQIRNLRSGWFAAAAWMGTRKSKLVPMMTSSPRSMNSSITAGASLAVTEGA